MNKIISSFILLFFSFGFLGANEGFSLKVHIDKLRDSKGVVICSLYNKDGTIPDEKFKKFYKQKRVKADQNGVDIVFKDLPKGRYAVNILHDENNNGKIDKGFILPVEGVGFSNFKSINIAHKPNFEKASFVLDRDKEIKIKVIYF